MDQAPASRCWLTQTLQKIVPGRCAHNAGAASPPTWYSPNSRQWEKRWLGLGPARPYTALHVLRELNGHTQWQLLSSFQTQCPRAVECPAPGRHQLCAEATRFHPSFLWYGSAPWPRLNPSRRRAGRAGRAATTGGHLPPRQRPSSRPASARAPARRPAPCARPPMTSRRTQGRWSRGPAQRRQGQARRGDVRSQVRGQACRRHERAWRCCRGPQSAARRPPVPGHPMTN